MNNKVLLNTLLFFSAFGFSSMLFSQQTSNLNGYWIGPHPELPHANFVFHFYEHTNNSMKGKGYWVQHGLYNAGFPIDSVTYVSGELRVLINAWGCIYEGKMSADGDSISGCFFCEGEQPDSVKIGRADKDKFYGLTPDHLDSKGNYTYYYKKPEQMNDGLPTDELQACIRSSGVLG